MRVLLWIEKFLPCVMPLLCKVKEIILNGVVQRNVISRI